MWHSMSTFLTFSSQIRAGEPSSRWAATSKLTGIQASRTAATYRFRPVHYCLAADWITDDNFTTTDWRLTAHDGNRWTWTALASLGMKCISQWLILNRRVINLESTWRQFDKGCAISKWNATSLDSFVITQGQVDKFAHRNYFNLCGCIKYLYSLKLSWLILLSIKNGPISKEIS